MLATKSHAQDTDAALWSAVYIYMDLCRPLDAPQRRVLLNGASVHLLAQPAWTEHSSMRDLLLRAIAICADLLLHRAPDHTFSRQW